MRKEAYLAYAAVTKDKAQRSIRPFYVAVKYKRRRFVRQYIVEMYKEGYAKLVLVIFPLKKTKNKKAVKEISTTVRKKFYLASNYVLRPVNIL